MGRELGEDRPDERPPNRGEISWVLSGGVGNTKTNVVYNFERGLWVISGDPVSERRPEVLSRLSSYKER